MTTPKRILCPTDFGEASREALRTATELAGVFCAELVLMHVVDPVRYVIACPEAYGFGAIVCASVVGRAVESATFTIRRLAAEVLPAGIARRERVEVGSPAARILGVAQSEGSDLIVIGARRRSWWRRFFDPSLAGLVARRSTCPVLVVPEPM
ncbi:MAG: universal stress protein [Thermotogota bacterium]